VTDQEAQEVKVKEVKVQTKRGQKWFAHVSGTVGSVVMLAIAIRYVTGLFGAWDHETLAFGQVWLGITIGFVCMLGSSAFAQVAVGEIGAGILGRFRPGGGGE